MTSHALIHNTILALPQGSFYSIYMDILQSTGKDLDNPSSMRAMAFAGLSSLLRERAKHIVLPPGWQSGTRGFNPVSGMASMPLLSGEGSLVMTGYQVLWIEHSSLE